jgi:hypothetical protein
VTTLEPIPGIDPDEMISLFNAPFEQVSKAMTEARNGFNSIVRYIKFSPASYSPVAALWIKNSLKEISHRLDQLVELVANAFKHKTPVISLIVQSFHWVNAVKKPMSDMSGKATNWSNNAYFTASIQAMTGVAAPVGLAVLAKAVGEARPSRVV